MSFAASPVRSRSFSSAAPQRFTVCLRLRLLADGHGEPVNGFRKALGEIDEDDQRIGVQLPDRREFRERLSSSISVVMRAVTATTRSSIRAASARGPACSR